MKHKFLIFTIMAVILSSCSTPTNLSTISTSSTTEQVPVGSSPMPVATNDAASVTVDDGASIDPNALSTAVDSIQSGVLSTSEADALLYMREEEKLARDVYLKLYEKWQLPVFQNIAGSEQTHTDAVKTLLDRYGLTDPFSEEIGVFENGALQNLYNQLITQGNLSIADALKVGGAIEEIDILDLEERLAQTDKADIILVYENLLKGSRNHLRSFVSTLQTQTGETYQPQYLTLDAYQVIINSPSESGAPGGKGPGK